MKRIGIIGLGGMGIRRLERLARIESVCVTAISTRSEQVLAVVAEQSGIPTTSTRWSDLIERDDLDAVCICTPNTSHAEIAIAAMRAGKDVFVEYPLAVTLQQLDELNAVAESTGRVLHLGATTRLEDQHVAVRERLRLWGEPIEARGVMALPYVWKWATDQDVMGSYFSLANYHQADQFIDWIGPPSWVSASLWQREQAGQITAISGSMFFGYDNGASCHINYTMGVPCQETILQFELICTEARVTFFDQVLRVQKLDGSAEIIDLPETDCVMLDTELFVQRILGELPAPDLTDQAVPTRVSLLAEQSAAQGGVTLRL